LKTLFTEWMTTDEGINHPYSNQLKWAPDLFMLLCKLLVNPLVSIGDKAKLASVVAYFAAPIDFIPEESEGPGGFVDDIALAAFVLDSIARNASPSLIERHWQNSEIEAMTVVTDILQVAEEMVGEDIWMRLQSRVS